MRFMGARETELNGGAVAVLGFIDGCRCSNGWLVIRIFTGY